MKIIHMADLHLGKRLNERNLIEDQTYILKQVVDILRERKPDVLIIAGDIYDRVVPSQEAVTLFDTFLNDLYALGTEVLIISGNHDSNERLSFASSFMERQGIHIQTRYDGFLAKKTYGDVNFYLLPFVKPLDIRRYTDEPIETYHDAIRYILEQEVIDPKSKNILVAHQFITRGSEEPILSDSETIMVGGLDNVDVSLFEAFDYVALGHIHRSQSIGRSTVRYSGSPLAYSQSEANTTKSLTEITIDQETLSYETIPLHPMRPVIELKGYLDDLLKHNTTRDEYIYVVLKDEQGGYQVLDRLRMCFPNLLGVSFEGAKHTQSTSNHLDLSSLQSMDPLSLFKEFYAIQNETEMDSIQESSLISILEALK